MRLTASDPRDAPLKPVIWIGSSRDDLIAFPEKVKDRMGYALFIAQQGAKHPDAKAFSGFGNAAVMEIVADHRSDAYRAVYMVEFEDAVYVLHAFQKKSKAGRETPKRDRELISERLKEATRMATLRRASKGAL